jgi:hypothetical protein
MLSIVALLRDKGWRSESEEERVLRKASSNKKSPATRSKKLFRLGKYLAGDSHLADDCHPLIHPVMQRLASLMGPRSAGQSRVPKVPYSGVPRILEDCQVFSNYSLILCPF